MTFWQAFKATYRGGTAFVIACPLLALFPVAFELLQHWGEVHIGMYDSVAAAKALEHHPLRMALGMVKVAALTTPIYWVTRFLWSRDARFAARFDRRAVRLFVPVLAFQLVMSAIPLFALSGSKLVLSIGPAQIISTLLLVWGVAAPLGNAAIGPRRSIAIMGRHLPWTIVFTLVAVLPLMVPHYALGAAALVGPKPLLWPVLVLDSLLVGWMAPVIVASGYVAAVRAADLAGVDLGAGESTQRADLAPVRA